MRADSEEYIEMQTFYQRFCEVLRGASAYNQAEQERPAVVLWTDKERQWEALIPPLQKEFPLLVLGAYDPEKRTGPALYLRCLIDRALPDADWSPEEIPVLYLPGVSKQELRAVESCPPPLQPLAELQYRGVVWTQINGRDWTIAAFLQNAEKGLGIAVSPDAATREAMQRALDKLAEEPVAALQKDAPLTAARFNALLNPEPVRNLLLYLDHPEEAKAGMDAAAWKAFCADCHQEYNFDPEKDGPLTAARLFADRQGAWNGVWNRFAEAPFRYGNLPAQLQKARPTKPDLLYVRESWPDENQEGETELRAALRSLESKTLPEAKALLRQLEKTHGERRNWVWAELGNAPLAQILPALLTLAESSSDAAHDATPTELAALYAMEGWKADAAVLSALAGVESGEDVAAVKAAVRGLYMPWLTASAETFQKSVAAHPILPTKDMAGTQKPGRCLLFADGLRYDVAQMLVTALNEKGMSVKSEWRFGPLPGVTPTAKPAVSPVAAALGPGPEFSAQVLTDGVLSDSSKVEIAILRRELQKAGYAILTDSETGTPSGAAWTESGSLDAFGHAQGWKLAKRVPEEIRSLTERIQTLLTAGWREVRIITDHGWLLLPGNLPSVSLPQHLTDGEKTRKGRCARLKPSSIYEGQTVAWHWDSSVRMAVAPGVSTFVAGKEYEHGGLSLQECVLPVLTVTAKTAPPPAAAITGTKWSGLRCRITLVDGGGDGLSADVRTKAGDSATSLAENVALVKNHQASVPVRDSVQEGDAAIVVLLDAAGNVLAQQAVIVGQ